MSGEGSLSSLTRTSIAQLSLLKATLDRPDCLYREELKTFNLDDECHRLALWAGNIGAHQKPSRRSSLDYRLKEAPQVRQQVARLLERLISTSNQANAICTGSLPNRREDDDDSDLDDESPWGQHSPGGTAGSHTSEIQELFLSVTEAITRLFRLSMAIRNPVVRDRYAKLATIEQIDYTFDVLHVKEKFPLTSTAQKTWIAERLGKANSQRRDYFRYRRLHQEKLEREEEEYHLRQQLMSQEINASLQQPSVRRDHRSRVGESSLGSTKASTYVQEPSGLKEKEPDELSDGGVSETSFATSVEESTSTFLRVPPPPVDLDEGVPFVCPYCFLVQSPANKRAWKRHVFADLQPYICTFQGCPTKPFTSRHRWFNHELEVHRKEWVCTFCRVAPFRSSTAFKSHLRKSHSAEVVESQFATLMDICAESLDKIEPNECPLCDEWAQKIKEKEVALHPDTSQKILHVTLSQFRRHLGGHLEQLALFSLPRLDGDEGSNVDSNDAVQDDASALSDEQSDHALSVDESDVSEGESPEIWMEIDQDEISLSRIEELLRDGADANSRGKNGISILHKAIASGNVKLVSLLLKNGADANVRSRSIYPLMHAINLNDYEMVYELLIHGADIMSKTTDGSTPLHYAVAASGSMLDIMKLLLDHGADMNATNEKGETVLQVAKRFARPDRISIIESRLAQRSSIAPEQGERTYTEALEHTVVKLQRRWRSLHLEQYLPLEPGSIRHMSDVAWLILRMHRSEWRKAPKMHFPSDPSVLEKIWGPLYHIDMIHTPRLLSFLRGIAKCVIDSWEPPNSIVIGPEKMQRFYSEFPLGTDAYRWQEVFDDKTSSISRLFRDLEVEHHLIQGRLDARPDIPALTPYGFAHWIMMLIEMNPVQERLRLEMFLAEYPVSSPDDLNNRFPKMIPARLFPQKEDQLLKERFETSLAQWVPSYKKANGLEVKEGVTNETTPIRPEVMKRITDEITQNVLKELRMQSLRAETGNKS